MGGKVHLLDAHLLERLYIESRSFEKQAASGTQTLQRELSLLYDKLVQRGLAGSRADQSRAAVAALEERFEALKLLLEQTRSFVESKMSGVVAAHGNKQQAESEADGGRPLVYAASARLKK